MICNTEQARKLDARFLVIVSITKRSLNDPFFSKYKCKINYYTNVCISWNTTVYADTTVPTVPIVLFFLFSLKQAGITDDPRLYTRVGIHLLLFRWSRFLALCLAQLTTGFMVTVVVLREAKSSVWRNCSPQRVFRLRSLWCSVTTLWHIWVGRIWMPASCCILYLPAYQSGVP